jgi:hypothetical protein
MKNHINLAVLLEAQLDRSLAEALPAYVQAVLSDEATAVAASPAAAVAAHFVLAFVFLQTIHLTLKCQFTALLRPWMLP